MRGRRTERDTGAAVVHSLLLALFFLAGAAAGAACANRAADSLGEELSGYLTDYLALSGGQEPAALGALAAAYLLAPLTAFLAGFASVGVAALPLTAAAFGFFPAYAGGCLAAAFGSGWLRLALGLFGFRCAVTVPCFFLLAVPAWGASMALFRMSFGRGRPVPPLYGRQWWLRLAGVLGVLLLGIFVDFKASPLLLRVVLERYF